MSYIFVGWAAVSSGKQADEDKISLTRQIALNVTEARRWGRMALQLVIPGFTRDITFFEEAATRVTGWRFDSTGLDELDGPELEAAIDARLADLRGTKKIYPYAELKELADKKAFNCFSFYNLGRVGRDAALSLTVMRLCQRSGIFTYSTKSPPASLDVTDRRTYQANLIDAIQAVGYENEVRQIQDNHRDGMIRRIKNGRMPGQVNFGYIEIRDHKGKVTGYDIDEPAARTIQTIVEWYLDHGMGCPQVADALNRAGHDTPDTRKAILDGKDIPDPPPQWSNSQVYFLLKRIMRYAGLNEINQYSKTGRPHITAPGMWPPIITEQRARAVTAERTGRYGTTRSVSNTYRFTRLVYCGVCGNRLSARNGYIKRTLKRTGETKKYYTLEWHCRAGGHALCTDKQIMRAVREAFDAIATMIEREGITADTPAVSPINVAQEEIDKLESTISRLKASALQVDLDHYVSAKIDASRHSAILGAIQQQILAAQRDITVLRDRLHALQFDASHDDRVDDVRKLGMAYLEDPDLAKANAWLRNRIRVYASPKRKFSVEII